jgi:hypothetical protein
MDSNYEFNAIQANRASQATKCTFYMLRFFVGIVNIVVVENPSVPPRQATIQMADKGYIPALVL